MSKQTVGSITWVLQTQLKKIRNLRNCRHTVPTNQTLNACDCRFFCCCPIESWINLMETQNNGTSAMVSFCANPVVCAYLEKMGKYPPVKMHNSESLSKLSEVVWTIVGEFRPLGFDKDLDSASLFVKAISKLPPNLPESWHFHTVMSKKEMPTLIIFSKWLQNRA